MAAIDPAEKVFRNPMLMKNILKNVEGGILRNLHIRLISNLFNDSCIQILQKEYRKLKIEYFGEKMPSSYYNQKRNGKEAFEFPVYINYRPVKLRKVCRYFELLKKVGVDVTDIKMKNLWKMCEKSQMFIHHSIIHILLQRNYLNIRSVIGMTELCLGCEECIDIRETCKEYGPTLPTWYLSSQHPKHIEKLITTDELHNSDVSFNWPSDTFTANLSRILNPKVTCDTLELHIPERKIYQYFDNLSYEFFELDAAVERRMDGDHALIPRQLLETIIRFWKVKNINIKMIHNSSCLHSYVWSTGRDVKKFSFNDPYETVEENERKPIIEKVNVDLSDSVNCVKGILGNDEKWESYQNLIANIRRLFSTNHISISFSHWSLFEGNSGIASHNFLNNILKTVFKEDQQNLRVDFQYFSKVDQLKYIDSLFHFKSNQFQITPRHSSISKKRFFEEKFLLEKWIGRNLKFEDKKKNCLINLEILINENELGKNVSQEILQDYPNSFAKYFIN